MTRLEKIGDFCFVEHWQESSKNVSAKGMKTIAFNGMKTIYQRKLCQISRMDKSSRKVLEKLLNGDIELSKNVRHKLSRNVYHDENKLVYYNKEASVFRNLLNFMKVGTGTYKPDRKARNHFDVQVSPDNRFIAYNTGAGQVILLEATAIKHKTDNFIERIEDCLRYSLRHVFDPRDTSRLVGKIDDWDFFLDNYADLLAKEQVELNEQSSHVHGKANIHELQTVKNFRTEKPVEEISQNMMAKNAAFLKYKNRKKNVQDSHAGLLYPQHNQPNLSVGAANHRRSGRAGPFRTDSERRSKRSRRTRLRRSSREKRRRRLRRGTKWRAENSTYSGNCRGRRTVGSCW